MREYKSVGAWSLPGMASKLTKLSQVGWEIEHLHYVLFPSWNRVYVLMRREVPATAPPAPAHAAPPS